jgi:drug/metabolite transporter (DMT)-like permease
LIFRKTVCSFLRTPSSFLSGFIIAFFGSILFSVKAILVKLAYRDTGVDAVTLLALRMIFSLPFFLVSAWVVSGRAENLKFTPKQWIYIAIVGCLGYYISSLLDFLGLQYVTAGIERLILFIYPTLVLLISSFYFKQKVKPIQLLAIAISYIGLVIAFLGEIDFQKGQTRDFYLGALLIFCCAITYATYIVGSGRLIPKVGAVKFNSYAMAFASAAVLLHFVINSQTSLISLSPLTYLYGFLMAIFATVLPSYMVAEGIKRIGSGNAAIVSSVGPVSTLVLAYFLLGESFSIEQIIGTIMILIGVYIIGKFKPGN